MFVLTPSTQPTLPKYAPDVDDTIHRMLEKPDYDENLILNLVRADYGICADHIEFLPIGYDVNTAVYRLTCAGDEYFLKVRRAAARPEAVDVPEALHSAGVAEVILPRRTRSGDDHVSFEQGVIYLYPFVDGVDGYRQPLSDDQWRRFGRALRSLHALPMQGSLAHLPRETYADFHRKGVLTYQAEIEHRAFSDAIMAATAELMAAHKSEITRLVDRADRLAQALRPAQTRPVVCHGDMHAGNLLIGPGGALDIVDWDTLVAAPRELDLMHIGGSALWNGERERRLFYEGYGRVEIDARALAYYRCERIVEDIDAFCAEIFHSSSSETQRRQSLEYFTRQFLPGHEVELALQTAPELDLEGHRKLDHERR